MSSQIWVCLNILHLRSECYSLLLRLHHADFLQQSLYKRNILMQPGPLTKPLSQRSIKTPSFRIIDFGRGECWRLFVKQSLPCYDDLLDSNGQLKEGTSEGTERLLRSAMDEWFRNKDYETNSAREEMMVTFWDY
jgi:hypothetical protein